jgi:pyruvate dehydrogenase E2 component (dihydrolipoamide acetyltransferase)
MAAFVMPSLGADMDAGKLVEWLKKPGDEVQARRHHRRGRNPEGGDRDRGPSRTVCSNPTWSKLGTKVPVGTPLAIHQGARREEEPAAEGAGQSLPVPATSQKPLAGNLRRTGACAEVPPPVVPAPAPGGSGLSPAARRKLAAEKGIDPATLTGSGPGGAIQLADVEAGRRKATDRGSPERPRTGGFDPARCARRSPQPWPARSARSRIITCRTRSTSPRRRTSSPSAMPANRRRNAS